MIQRTREKYRLVRRQSPIPRKRNTAEVEGRKQCFRGPQRVSERLGNAERLCKSVRVEEESKTPSGT